MKKGYEILKKMLSLIMVFTMVLTMLPPVTVKAANSVSGGNIYFDNSKTGWTDQYIYFVIGKNDWSSLYKMEKVGGTDNLYYKQLPNWDGSTYYAIIGTSAAWGDGNWGPSNLGNANHYTAAYTSNYGLNAGSNYVFTPNGKDNGTALNIGWYGTTPYAISVSGTENGTVTASKTVAEKNNEISLTVTPNTGYELDKLTVKNGTNEVTVTDNKFTMPAGNVTVSATFKKISYNVTFNGGAYLTSNGASTAEVGTAYTATLQAAEGYALPETVEVKVGGTAITTHTFENGVLTIPAASVTGDIVITAEGVEQIKDTVLYLTPNANWKVDNARFAAYFFGNGDTWVSMTDTDGDGVYEVIAPAGYPNVIFCRMNPGATANNWDNKWNQTSDLTVPTDGKNHYTVAEGAWDNGAGTWSVFTPAEPEPETHTVTFNGTGVTSNGASTATEGMDYTATLTAAEGYTLPETVTVTVGGIAITTHTFAEGILTVPADSVTGDIVITAEGVEQIKDTVLYLTPNANWKVDNARFAAYFFGNGDAWVSMTDTDGDGVYEVTAPAGYPNVIFCRMNPGATANNWDNKWNQTSDLTVPTDGKNHYTVAEGAWDNGAGTWSVFTPAEPEPEPTGKDYYLVGYINGADVGIANDSANLGSYKFVDGKVTVEMTSTSYVVVKDSTGKQYWAPAFCQTDSTVLAEGNGEKMQVDVGTYEFTLVENADGTLTLSYVAEAEEDDESQKTTYTAIFHFANTLGWNPVNLYVWNDDGASTGNWPGTAMTKKDDNGYYTMTVNYEAATNYGLNYIFNNGSQQTVDLSLAASAFDETANIAEVWVELDAAANSEGKYVTKKVSDKPLDIVLAVSPRIDGSTVTFEFAGDSSTTSVELRGTVPGASWDRGIAMTKNAKGLWSATVENVDPGVYEYKFVVNGTDWIADPANGKTNAEGNSVFTIADPNAVDTNEITINVYYNRTDGIYTVANADGAGVDGTWNAYVWGTKLAGTRKDYAADGNGKMMFTMKVVGRDTLEVALKNRLSTAAKEWLKEESQVTIDLKEIVSGTVNVYIESNGANGMNGSTTYSMVTGTDVVFGNKVTSAQYDYQNDAIVVKTTEALNSTDELSLKSPAGGITVKNASASGTTYTLKLSGSIALHEMEQYKVVYDGYEYDIAIDSAYATKKFADEYTYTGKDLGANYTTGGTTFKVWAPTATGVNVLLYADGNALDKFGNHANASAPIGTYPMEYTGKGVWAVTVPGDLNGTYYTYEVFFGTESVEAVDPYARTTGVNGMRGMVINLDATDPVGWASDTNPNPVTSQTDAVIYELHVRDFSIDASSGVSAANRGKYLAFTEEGTTTANGVTTGIDYLDELGVTHLHLLPVYDYASVDETKCNTFNWGYDPQNYNVPEGSYSTDPTNGAVRVNEFKQMVMALHEHGISVVMDVVYNHVYDADTFCYNNIVPGYFSRPNSNTSGCGNDTASEREMVRKYIVESVLYWAEEYHIDGFRFDLVGLLDVETINQIVTEVHKLRPDVIFYGEGWDMDSTNREPGTEMAKQGNASKTPGFAYFSDTMRNGIGGNNGNSTGFASGAGNGASMAAEWMANPWWTTNPQQIIQYASCHDNYTLADKLIISTKTNGVTDNIIKMNNLAAAFYMTSQGVPFIHAGEEFLREKITENGDRSENSYNASDFVNHLDWTDLETYAENVEYYKGLIAFRAENPALRYATAAEVSANVQNITTEANLLVFRVDANGTASTEDEDILVIFNANKSAKTVELPAGQWTIYVNGEDAGTTTLGTAEGTVSVAGISAMVLTTPDLGEDEDAPLGASEEKTLYFSNNKGWDKVYAYAWTDGGETILLGAWPGAEMTYVETNDYGEKIYSVTLPASETGIEGLIFTNNAGEQTVDIVPGIDGTGYYCTDKNADNKWEVGTYTFRAPNLGAADEYFLVGYINGVDYVGGDYPFDENGQIKVTFPSDSYLYVINGDSSETYMTDGYQGAVTSATLKDTAKHSLTADKWDKLLIPGGAEVTITMVKNNDKTVTLSYEMNIAGVEDASGVQDGVTLHCWNWSFSEIEKNMAAIAELGYTAIQTSPIQPLKEATNLATNSVGSHWWVYYQPVDFVITTDSGNALGTKEDLQSMIETAHAYGVQVIVDVVANHLGNKTGNDLSDKIPEYLLKDEYWHNIDTNISNWNDRYDMTQNCLDGLPDLNTAHDDIQGYVLDFLTECIDAGVDGFRFDMAKSIETHRDDASFASDFWPAVVGGAETYAEETYGKDLYIYGEVLDNPVISVSAYTEYMAITDNSWGNNLRTAIVSGTAALSEGYHKAAGASNLVIWAESHDTYATDDASQSSAAVSEANINKTWALVAARADAMGLYLARPESMSQALGVASVTGWDNEEVKAVNLFHNAFAGQSESIGNENGISYVERGTSGVVLVNVKGNAAEVSVTANAMADGSYVDQITGNVFTVANGKITGKIGDSGIAVVYNLTEYKITKGAGSTWTKDSSAGLEFTANGEYAKFTGVAVDGLLLSTASYESKSGSTVVTLKTTYLGTLSVGEHTLEVQYVDGIADCTFSVKAAQTSDETTVPETTVPETTVPGTTAPETTVPETTAPETKPSTGTTPPTGDDSNIFLWSMLVLVSAAAAAAWISTKKRFFTEE